ncbi:MAG TPA: carboxypeptidase-like regulatory domain-containing protein [Vicinamibacterales bacterium]|nr:carboxypeptidase-like regulatory domain-containing protein [Vicinamibacterales bacterium]
MRAAAFALSLALVGLPAQAPSGRIDVRVVTSQSTIIGAEVYLRPMDGRARKGFARDDGVATFTGLLPGIYQVFTPQGSWSPKSAERVVVREGEHTEVELRVGWSGARLECSWSGNDFDDTPRGGRVPAPRRSRTDRGVGPRGSIYGVVRDTRGNPLPVARVQATNRRSGWTEYRRTELTGEFGIGDLAPGLYDLDVHAAGYDGHRVGVTVAAAQRDLAFTLSASAPPGAALAPSDRHVIVNLETGWGGLLVALDRSSEPSRCAR